MKKYYILEVQLLVVTSIFCHAASETLCNFYFVFLRCFFATYLTISNECMIPKITLVALS